MLATEAHISRDTSTNFAWRNYDVIVESMLFMFQNKRTEIKL